MPNPWIRKAAALLSTALFVIFLTFDASDAFGQGGVTPYGDYCRDCAAYGYCKKLVSQQEAVKSIENYYKGKKCTVRDVVHKGRFVEAAVYSNGVLVDRVVFDRKTGRLRSIY